VKFARAICYRQRNSIGLVDTPAPVPPGLDLDLWCGPSPMAVPIRKKFHYDWHWVFETGNGDLGNQNPHELDKARWGLQKQELPKEVVSLGGRLGYLDNGNVANCQLTLYRWDDAFLISDVRGLPIKSPITLGLKNGAGVAFDYDGNQIAKWSGGEYQAHFANFVKAIRSRDHKDLHLDIEDGHLSSALAHLGNVSYRTGTAVPAGTRPSEWVNDRGVAETLDSFESYLGENAVDFDQTKYYLGRTLKIDPKTELSTDSAANALFKREYRSGYELPEVTG
jgi:hypothetical protein